MEHRDVKPGEKITKKVTPERTKPEDLRNFLTALGLEFFKIDNSYDKLRLKYKIVGSIVIPNRQIRTRSIEENIGESCTGLLMIISGLKRKLSVSEGVLRDMLGQEKPSMETLFERLKNIRSESWKNG